LLVTASLLLAKTFGCYHANTHPVLCGDVQELLDLSYSVASMTVSRNGDRPLKSISISVQHQDSLLKVAGEASALLVTDLARSIF
jgi:hypothetical protein